MYCSLAGHCFTGWFWFYSSETGEDSSAAGDSTLSPKWVMLYLLHSTTAPQTPHHSTAPLPRPHPTAPYHCPVLSDYNVHRHWVGFLILNCPRRSPMVPGALSSWGLWMVADKSVIDHKSPLFPASLQPHQLPAVLSAIFSPLCSL